MTRPPPRIGLDRALRDGLRTRDLGGDPTTERRPTQAVLDHLHPRS